MHVHAGTKVNIGFHYQLCTLLFEIGSLTEPTAKTINIWLLDELCKSTHFCFPGTAIEDMHHHGGGLQRNWGPGV